MQALNAVSCSLVLTFSWHCSFVVLLSRARKVLEIRSQAEDERIDTLEKQLEEAKWIAEDTDRKYDEVTARMY